MEERRSCRTAEQPRRENSLRVRFLPRSFELIQQQRAVHANSEVRSIDERETLWVVRLSVILRAYSDEVVDEAEYSPGKGESLGKTPVTKLNESYASPVI